MAEIKTRDSRKGSVRTLDKVAAGTHRVKQAYVSTKDKAENSVDVQENSAEEYAANRALSGAKKATDKGVEVTGKTVRKGTEKATNTAKKQIQKHIEKQAERTAQKATNKTVRTAQQTSRSVKQTARSAGKKTVKTAQKGAVKTAKSSVKTAERTSKAAIKTAKETAKAAQKTAKATAKAAQKAAQAARATAKAAVKAAKLAIKATIAAIKAIIAGVKALAAAIAAGGWVAVVIIIVICLIGLIVGSCFGIFASGEDSGTGVTMQSAVQEINDEYNQKIEKIKTDNRHDEVDMSGSRAAWKEVIAIYAVDKNMADLNPANPDEPQEVATMDDGKKADLKKLFWEMNTIEHKVENKTVNMTEIGAVIDGKYEILKEIGKGGMSIVYLAMDKHLNKQWAVKEIRKKGSGKNDEIVVNSLLAEANLMKKLDHPSLPRIVDIIDNGVTIYVIMDYIEGESLDKILGEYGAQPEDLVINWAKQLCDALSYLHSQKPPIIYRDMKPANVMLKPEGNIKIIDFGIAREYKEQNLADTTVLGTKGYAPPEQYSGQTDARSDIFALGMTMHHLLTGIDPRKGDAYAPVRQWNPELSEGIEIIINKCVEPASENRYQTCEDLLYDLEHPELITKGYKKKQKRKLMSFIISVGMCVVFLLSGVICNFAAAAVNESNYDYLISVVSSTALDEKIEGYKQAIAIYPDDTRAYMKMLEAYENEGKFSKEENDQFLAVYNANKDKLDTTTVEVANLKYQIGTMYLNYYTDDGENYVLSNRIQKAFSFFEENYNNKNIPTSFEYKKLSDCYYQICSFYKKYILSSATVEEASKDNYQTLFETIESSIEELDRAGPYEKLSLYNSVFMLLYDQRDSLASVGMEEDEVQDLLSQVYNDAKNITVQKEQSKKLQQEIVDNYDDYSLAISRTYSNTSERS